MKLIETEFKHKGVDFKVIKRGRYTLLLEAKAEFYDCESVEVWKIRHSKERIIQGKTIDERERKPSNEDYPTDASQYFVKRYNGRAEMMEKAMVRFNKYESSGKLKELNQTNSK